MSKILSKIPYYQEWETIQKIDQGWSTDEKYYVKNQKGQEFLLRIASKKEFGKKQVVFKRIR